jgi:hypothetical protein
LGAHLPPDWQNTQAQKNRKAKQRTSKQTARKTQQHFFLLSVIRTLKLFLRSSNVIQRNNSGCAQGSGTTRNHTTPLPHHSKGTTTEDRNPTL